MDKKLFPVQINRQRRLRGAICHSVTTIILSGSLLALPGQASATDRRVATERFTEYARVIDVQPVFQEVRVREPRQECWIEQQEQIVGYENTSRPAPQRQYDQANRQHSAGNAVIGGLIGGVIGNQLGRRHSSSTRAGATVAGAIIGGAIGNESAGHSARHRRNPPPRHVESRPIYESTPVERCRRVVESHSERKLQHYNVTYEYKGRNFVTQLPRDPGNRLELQVTVAPARR